MKLRYGSVIIILAIFVAVIVTGCTQSSPGVATPKPTATSTAGGLNVPAIDFSKVTAYEYKITTVAGDQQTIGYWRMEWNTAPYSSVMNAKHERFTVKAEGTTGMSSMIVDTYSDPATGRGLGGYMKIMQGDQELSNTTIPADQASSTVSGQQNPLLTDATSANFASTLVSAGQETLTVQAGTFPCTKYVVTMGNFTANYWISSTVPIPIKMTQVQDGKLVSSMELVDYKA